VIDPLLRKPPEGKLTKDLFSKFGMESPALVILTEKGRPDSGSQWVPDETLDDPHPTEAIFSEGEVILSQSWAINPENGKPLKPWGHIVNLETGEEFEIESALFGKALSLSVWSCRITPTKERLYKEEA
jgi:hypothetical protein